MSYRLSSSATVVLVNIYSIDTIEIAGEADFVYTHLYDHKADSSIDFGIYLEQAIPRTDFKSEQHSTLLHYLLG